MYFWAKFHDRAVVKDMVRGRRAGDMYVKLNERCVWLRYTGCTWFCTANLVLSACTVEQNQKAFVAKETHPIDIDYSNRLMAA